MTMTKVRLALPGPAARHNIGLVKHLKRADNACHHCKQNLRAEQGNCHGPQATKTLGAIDILRIQNLLRQIGQSAQEYQECKTHIPPSRYDGDGNQDKIGRCQPGNLRYAQQRKVVIQWSEFFIEYIAHKDRHRCARHQQGQEERRAKIIAQPYPVDAVHSECQDQPNRNLTADGKHGEFYCIDQTYEDTPVFQQALKIFQADIFGWFEYIPFKKTESKGDKNRSCSENKDAEQCRQ